MKIKGFILLMAAVWMNTGLIVYKPTTTTLSFLPQDQNISLLWGNLTYYDERIDVMETNISFYSLLNGDNTPFTGEINISKNLNVNLSIVTNQNITANAYFRDVDVSKYGMCFNGTDFFIGNLTGVNCL